MTKSQSNKHVGDIKSPVLPPTKSDLRHGADQAQHISADKAPQASTSNVLANLCTSLKAASERNGAPSNCKQNLWLSYFFDGTGNNLGADVALNKHSNVVRLYRAHKPENKQEGIFALYIPGIGTYFPEIGDDGGSMTGLGCGAMGEERIEFAIESFEDSLKQPLALASAPANAIEVINIAVFGFSRGAALARAFVNTLMQRKCVMRNKEWKLRRGGWPVKFRFMGLFDTVASVGLTMSSNTTGIYEAYNGDTAGMISKRLENYRATRPEILAYRKNASAGADPAPGNENGHRDWGSLMRIHESVEEVRHFVAAHEIRNSFPVDSITIFENDQFIRPDNFHEALYPGAHSDVGGGYATGEGARSFISSSKLSLVPLNHMHTFALRKHVPMLPCWTQDNKSDFNIDEGLCEAYDQYIRKIGAFSNLGDGLNAHMALYYAWRFQAIRRKLAGNENEAKVIQTYNNKFRQSDSVLSKEVASLKSRQTMTQVSLGALMHMQEMPISEAAEQVSQYTKPPSDLDIEKAREKHAAARRDYLKAKSRLDALPNMSQFKEMTDLYDRQLLIDVRAIRAAAVGAKRLDLRPHYRVLLEAYENEFERNAGLKDEKIINFFDNYVHDSLAGFGKDATLPSDPRVVYLGDDEKYRYAELGTQASKADNRGVVV